MQELSEIPPGLHDPGQGEAGHVNKCQEKIHDRDGHNTPSTGLERAHQVGEGEPIVKHKDHHEKGKVHPGQFVGDHQLDQAV